MAGSGFARESQARSSRARGVLQRMRGTAAVELILSLPFLAMFVVAMYDFAIGYSTRSQAARASRHVAWHSGRTADGTLNNVGSLVASDVHDAHYGKKTRSLRRQTDYLRAPLDIPDVGASWFDSTVSGGFNALDGAVSWLESPISIWGFNIDLNVQVAAGLPSYLVGTVTMQHGESSAGVRPRAGLGDVWVGPQRVASHSYVAMQTWREPDPGEPEGWFDPIQRLLAFLGNIGTMIGAWLAEAAQAAAEFLIG